MSGNETLYTFVNRGAAFYERAKDNTSSLPVRRDMALVVPSVVGCTLVNATGQTIATATTGIVNDIATATFLAGDLPATLAYGPTYRELWTLTLDGEVFEQRRDVTLGHFALHPPVSDEDILTEYPDLVASLGEFGTSVQGFMDNAWRMVCRTIERRGDYPDIIVQSSDIYDWYMQECLEKMFRALCKFQQSNDRWAVLWQHHTEQAKLARESMTFRADRTRDGNPDSDKRERTGKAYVPNMPPRRRTYNPRW